MNALTRRIATANTAGALLLGGAVATASTASAATTSKTCTHSAKLNTYVDATVMFRTGPGTGYTAKGQLSKNTRIYYACYKGNWGYVKPSSGAHKGETGWVSRSYISIPMQLD
ncbi:SH3 domain-containing protein [Actinacidiphila sp. ITFR-21]|uniref:SH3 domain-containing protein n=1 Tax=Actinacidiphila sp. ITFR-21 TaxID=3075199 RepID=UPI00288AB58F|nr:SH3 domain-containing protein [Streptomyces sp. ITFR-21]WNI20093.1 SH3 domain-containing protein [Streptomyces sp. ITFR-21]